MEELAIDGTSADAESVIIHLVRVAIHLVHLCLCLCFHFLVQQFPQSVLLGAAHVQEALVESPVAKLSHQFGQAELVRYVQLSRPIAGNNGCKDAGVLVEEILVIVVRIKITVV